MRKATIATFAVLCVAGLVFGCATTAKGPSDQEQVQKVFTSWQAAAKAQNVDQLLSLYSDKFEHYEWGNKEGFKKFVKDSIDMGYLQNMTLDTSKTKITFPEKEKATIYPIEMKAAFGSATVELLLAKEKTGWLITGMNVQMY